MTRQIIIERIIKIMEQLPEDKAIEISDFSDFIFKRFEKQELARGIQKLVSGSQTF